jgi:hypothetical protein
MVYVDLDEGFVLVRSLLGHETADPACGWRLLFTGFGRRYEPPERSSRNYPRVLCF